MKHYIRHRIKSKVNFNLTLFPLNCRIKMRGDFMTLYQSYKQKLKLKKIKQKTIYESLGCSKQNYYKHINNLKNNNITFSGNQIMLIDKITGIKII
ncbi:MAG: hypothetical protein ACRC0S_02130 [Fusobacteriaceae bacterium]